MVAKLFVLGAPVLGFLITVAIGLAGVFKLHKIFSPLAFIVCVFPSAVGLFVVLRTVRKSKSNTAFLYNQILWGAIPGYITAAVLRDVFSASAVSVIVAGQSIFNARFSVNPMNASNSSIATNASLVTVPRRMRRMLQMRFSQGTRPSQGTRRSQRMRRWQGTQLTQLLLKPAF